MLQKGPKNIALLKLRFTTYMKIIKIGFKCIKKSLKMAICFAPFWTRIELFAVQFLFSKGQYRLKKTFHKRKPDQIPAKNIYELDQVCLLWAVLHFCSFQFNQNQFLILYDTPFWKVKPCSHACKKLFLGFFPKIINCLHQRPF